MKKHLALSRTRTFTGFLLLMSGLSTTPSEAFRRVRFVAIAESRFNLPKQALTPNDPHARALDYPDTTLTCQLHLRNVSGTDQEISILDLRYFSAPTPNTGAHKHNEQGNRIGTRGGNSGDTSGMRSTLLNQTFIYRLNSRTNAQNTISPISDFPVTLNRYSMHGDAALIQWRRRVPIIPNYDNDSQVAQQQHVTHYCTGTIEVRDVTTQSITKPGAIIASGALEFVAGSEMSAPRQTTQIIPANSQATGGRLANLVIDERAATAGPVTHRTNSFRIVPRSPILTPDMTNPDTATWTIGGHEVPGGGHHNPGRVVQFNEAALRSGVQYYLFPDARERRFDIAQRLPGSTRLRHPIYRLSTDPAFYDLATQLNHSGYCAAAAQPVDGLPTTPAESTLNTSVCNSSPCAEDHYQTGGQPCITNANFNFSNSLGANITYNRLPDPNIDPFFNFTVTPAGSTNAPNIPGVYYNFPQHIHSMPIVINGGKPF